MSEVLALGVENKRALLAWKVKELLDKVTGSERNVLRILYQHGELTTKDVCRELVKPYPQVSRDLNTLEGKGFLASKKGEKTRGVFYKIKDEYTEAIPHLFKDDFETQLLIVSINMADLMVKGEKESVELLMKDPELNPQQKEIAIREFLKLYRTTAPLFLYDAVAKAKEKVTGKKPVWRTS